MGDLSVPQTRRQQAASLAWLLVVVQVGGFLLIREPLRAWVSNVVQVVCCLTAAAFCLDAARRSRQLARTF